MEENNVNTPPIKKKRGNPNLQKGHKNQHIKKETMAENTETTTTEEKKVETENTSSTNSNPVTDLPKDIFSDEMPKEEVLPLDGEMNVKDYAKIADPTGTNSGTGNPPPGTGQTPPTGDAYSQAQQTPPTIAPITTEEMNNQAEQTVSLMLKGYEKLHALGRYIGKIDQQELMALHSKGKIDLNADLPLGSKTIKVGEFFNEYNAGIDENITVSEEFKKEITPPLTRICIKHKLFLSDEMYVGMIVLEDAATKASILLGLKRSANLVLEAVTQMNASKGKQNTSGETTEDTSSADAWREPEITEVESVS